MRYALITSWDEEKIQYCLQFGFCPFFLLLLLLFTALINVTIFLRIQDSQIVHTTARFITYNTLT